MARAGPKKTNRYSEQFKATAIRLSQLPEVLIQDVATALDIHPFMLSRWRKQAREGKIMTRGVKLDVGLTAHRTLRERGVRVGEKRVAQLMRERGIKARVARLRYGNRRLRDFFTDTPNCQLAVTVDAADQVWVGDITYLQVGERWRYLAAVMDKCSRRIVGWSLGKQKDVRLTLRALNHAVINRRPPQGPVFHSDRGIEDAAFVYRDRLLKLGFRQSMNRPGAMNDNAHMESFFHSMKADVIHGRVISDDGELATVVKSYMSFYNRTRMHSSLDYRAPVAKDRLVNDKCGVNKIG